MKGAYVHHVVRLGAQGASRMNLVLPCGEAVVIVIGLRDGLGSAFRAVEQGRGMQQHTAARQAGAGGA